MQSLAITKKGSSWEHSLGFCVVCFHRKNGGWSSFKTEKKNSNERWKIRVDTRVCIFLLYLLFSLDGVYGFISPIFNRITFLSSLSHATYASN